MTKVTLVDVASLESENTAIATMTANNTTIETAFDNTLSLDGTTPNSMGASLDMNSNRLINLPTPGGDNDAARKIDIDNAMMGSYSGQVINGTANEITASTVTTTTTLSLPTGLTFTGKTVTGGTFASITLTAPALGTPASGVLTNCTSLPLSSVTGLGTGVATFLATPTSANLLAAITDETGTGALVFANTPTLVTPVLGAATGTSLTATGTIVSTGTAGIGYATGAGGAVTQITSRSTGVTLNKTTGAITVFTAAAVVGTWITFVCTNSTVAINDTVVYSISGGSNTYAIAGGAVAAGSHTVNYLSIAGTASDAPVIHYTVIKGVQS